MPPAKKDTCVGETNNRLCFESGDTRTNQNLLLVSVHNVWFREHNRIARKLKKVNPQWDDEILYQEARRINIAIYQNIIFSEWLPLLLGLKFLLLCIVCFFCYLFIFNHGVCKQYIFNFNS